MFSCVVGKEGHCKEILLACVGSAHNGWTTLGLPQPRAACVSWVHTAQAPGCSARALSQVDPAFLALPRSKQLRFSHAPQGHRPSWVVCFVPFPGLKSSGDQMFGEHTVPGEPCVLCTSLIPAAWFPRCITGEQTLVCHVSSLGS